MDYSRIGIPPDPGERFDGILAIVGKHQEVDVIRNYPHVPCVDMSGAWLWDLKDPAASRVARVTYDPAALGRMAADHMLGRGFKTLAFINTCNGWQERPGIAACAQLAKENGAAFFELRLYRELGVAPPYTRTRLPQAMCWLGNALRTLPKPCGIIVVDDWGPSLLRVCEHTGISVPEELAVMGLFNILDACEYASIPISAVDAGFEHIAFRAAQQLDRLMKGKKRPKKPILLPPKGLVIRQSTDVLAVDHREVAAALRFIWQHFREPIQAKDVVAHTTMSYRGLALAFEKQLGRTIADEIARKRIDEARRLLSETDLKATLIAKQSGFSGLEHLSRAFKRSVGQAPAVYRRNQRNHSRGETEPLS